jgi:hypothetical protein
MASGGTTKNEATTPAGGKTPAPRRRWLRACLRLFGVASLSYVLGAAVMFFELPTSAFLRNAFVGGSAWYETRRPQPQESALPVSVGKIDQPEKTCDGFTLLMYGGNSRAMLVDMRGNVVHRWHIPFSQLWPDPTHVGGRVEDAAVYFNDGHVFPNGDLVVVVEGPANQNTWSNGYGLAKLDKDSHVLWKYAHKCHHDLDVGDDGTIYVLANEMVDEVPPGLEYIPTPCIVDFVHVLSAEGKPLKRIPLLKALKSSPYAPLLSPLERPRRAGGPAPLGPPGGSLSPLQDDALRRDVLHTNAVKVLRRSLASAFPQFQAGQLLVSPRHLDALAVLDPDTEKVVWAARGPWRAQHDPSFLANGHLLLFDNLGSPQGSRVLEYDPQTQAYPWSYPGESGIPFFSRIRGMCQRLANGNTLIVNSDGGEAFEVNPGQEVVWSCSCGLELYRARRYTPDQLPFLKGGPRARP